MFAFDVPRPSAARLSISIDKGQVLFILGANGTGKSTLMHRIFSSFPKQAYRISAHRRTWLTTNTIDISPAARRNTEVHIVNSDMSPRSRYTDDYAEQRSSIAIYDLIDAENVRAREIAGAVDANDLTLARTLAEKGAPIKIINELLRDSSLPIEIMVEKGEQLSACKSGGQPYSIAELSDGERNALLIAASVLTVPEGTLVVVDEPERHLHRSIISPLLTLLFAKRPDCAFVVSTHEVNLPLDNPRSQTLLIRSCTFSGSDVSSWDLDPVSPNAEIDDQLKCDILGSRRKMLFVEGKARSLDHPLYSLIFPGVSVVSKGSCRSVEQAVRGIRDSSSLHWLEAWGIVDNDSRSEQDIEEMRANGIYALPFYSIESVYFHPQVIDLVTTKYASVTGEDPTKLAEEARQAALGSLAASDRLRFSARRGVSTVRDLMLRSVPKVESLSDASDIKVEIALSEILSREIAIIEGAIAAGDFLTIVSRYPIRESQMIDRIVRKIGLTSRDKYEGAVLKLLAEDADARELVRAFFRPLNQEMGVA